MIQTGLIPNAHNDLVTDASYDFYGLHLATCSLDQRYVFIHPSPRALQVYEFRHAPCPRVKVWQLDESTGSWSLEHDWKVRSAKPSNPPMSPHKVNIPYV